MNRELDNGLSGAYYLMQKSDNKGVAGRKHVIETHAQSRSSQGRRHFQEQGPTETTADLPHASRKSSTQMRVFNDLMSSIADNDYHRVERPSTSGGQRQKHNTMHRTSQEIGLQYTKQPSISKQKQAEIAGNGLDK